MKHRHGIRATLAALLVGAGSSAAVAVPPTVIGVNIAPPAYYRPARAFANLAIGAEWGASDHQKLGSDSVDENGNVKHIPAGITLGRMLTPPNSGTRAATIRCTWHGKGNLKPTSRRAQNIFMGAGTFTFETRSDETLGRMAPIPLSLTAIDASDPIRDLDCRETSIPADARFDPQFLDTLRGFKVIRFMDWQQTNGNEPVTWATRNTPRSIDIMRGDGVSIEDMIALTKQTSADPWFNIPWNADDDYVERFAKMVHDGLPDRTVYVELGNEVWNYAFKTSKQAIQEGQAEGLSPNGLKAGLMRYAERTAHAMDIWAKVYADRPKQLVRVAACQNGANCATVVLGFKDTARHVDALATAPYFGGMINKTPPTSTDDAYGRMNAEIDRVIDAAVGAKGVATQHGKRYIAYEAGQHLMLRDMDLQQKIQRDPRMYDAYKYYLESWRTKLGDTITLYNSAGSIGRFGAWGLSEYIGQPLADAPKLRAVREEIASTGGGKRP